MKIVSDSITRDELKRMAAGLFGDMVKAVVDVDQGLLGLDAELHADIEAALLEAGSSQSDLWGINLYPEKQDEGFIEFDSLINVRPSQGNKSRGVDDDKLRGRIIGIVAQRVGP